MTLEDLELTDPIEPVAPDPSDHVAFEHCKIQINNTMERYGNVPTFAQDYTTWCLDNAPK